MGFIEGQLVAWNTVQATASGGKPKPTALGRNVARNFGDDPQLGENLPVDPDNMGKYRQ